MCANEFGPPTGENEEFEPWSADDEKEAMEFTAAAEVAAEMRHCYNMCYKRALTGNCTCQLAGLEQRCQDQRWNLIASRKGIQAGCTHGVRIKYSKKLILHRAW